ncbi:MAG: MmcQ/YjbR family DNA-binding protein [Balneolaceae bacterium]
MNLEEFRSHCLSKKGATESIPFPKLPDVLVFKVKGKMFAVTDLENFDGFTIKCIPETIDELRAQYPAFQKPPYFSDRHWSSVTLDGSIEDELLYQWIDTSYHLVVAKLTKKVREELENE